MIIKHKSYEGKVSYHDAGYWTVVFKNDLIKLGKSIYEVKSARFDPEHGVILEVYTPKHYSGIFFEKNFYLFKRPVKNWFKYLWLLITKKY